MSVSLPKTIDWNAMADEDLAAHLSRFVENNCPKELRFVTRRQRWDRVQGWYKALSAGGLLAPAWPVEHGGMGLSPRKHLLYLETLDKAGAPKLHEQGIMNLGPALIIYGTDEQRRHYLPRILAGDDVWCQGFSEPNAGSDLASLRTEGRVVGDEIIITGQKIWTSMAFDANHMFMLVRTDPAAKKQAGITFVMLDFKQPGITVRPIQTIAGHVAFCECFFDGARARLADVIGGVNNGWKVATSLLGSERLWAGSPRHSQKVIAKVEALARALGCENAPLVRDRITRLKMDILDLASTYQRTVSSLETGESRSFGFEASVLKIFQTEMWQRLSEFLVELAGNAGALDGEVSFGDLELDILYTFYESRPPTIMGGSVEIHRNIISKNVLKLPA